MRTFDRLLSLLLGIAGLVLGVLGTVEVVVAALRRPPLVLPYPQVASWLRQHTWSAGVVVAIAAALLAVGLVLLLLELKPRRRTQLVLQLRDPAVTTTLSVHSLARLLETTAVGTPGVDRAHGRVRRRRARVRLDVSVPDPAEVSRIQEQARAAASAALEDLHLRRAPRLTVRTKRRSA
jgi:hypothetical protein